MLIESFLSTESLAGLVSFMGECLDREKEIYSVTAMIQAWQVRDMLELMLPRCALANISCRPYDTPEDDVIVVIDEDMNLWVQSIYTDDGELLYHSTDVMLVYGECRARSLDRIESTHYLMFNFEEGGSYSD